MAKRHTNRIGDLESLFTRLEELVLANSGEDEFEEVFKLLIAKLWDERCGKAARFRAYGTELETYQHISTLLREAERAWPGIIEAGTTSSLAPEHLQVCVGALAPHTISAVGLEVMDGLFEFLVAKGSKGAKGQYFTPRHVIEMCVQMLDPQPEETVVDPACGSAGFLVHAFHHAEVAHKLRGPKLQTYASSKLWGFDFDGRAVRVAKALMILAGDGHSNILRLNSLLRPDMGGLFPISKPSSDAESSAVLTIEDVTRSRMRRHKGFDVVLTNPPFAGEVRERHILEGYELARGKTMVERDVLFIERCMQLLRPGGRMAIVLPHNKFAMGAWGYVRQWLMERGRVLAVVGLGRNTFLPHTHQKASVLFVQKHAERAKIVSNPRIFFAISENDGKDSRGQFVTRAGVSDSAPLWDRVEHDLGDIVEQFRESCRTEHIDLKG